MHALPGQVPDTPQDQPVAAGSGRSDVPTDADDAARAALARQKRRATLLLAAMAGLVGIGFLLKQGFLAGLLRASAKAGLVGGLADWFAVTALFRHPLGLPIPHTAIIPAQKQRLGRALGGFVSTHVFTEADVDRALGAVDLPGLLRALLLDERNAALLRGGLARAVPMLLDGVPAGRGRAVLAALLPRIVDDRQLAPVVARALRALVDGDRHQEVLSFLLDQIKLLLKSREAHLRQLIEERVREQGGRLVGWAIGGSVASRVLSAINVELDRTDPRDSDMREAVTAWIRREIDLIETDPVRGRELGAVLRGLFTHDSLRLWATDVGGRLRGAVEEDLRDPDGWANRLLADLLVRAGEALRGDDAVRGAVDRGLRGLLRQSLPSLRAHMSGFIAGVVSRWDTAHLTERLELRVGRDLQFVRINGTLVGAAAGGALFLLLRLGFGFPDG